MIEHLVVCIIEGQLHNTVAFDSDNSAKLFCGGFNMAGSEYGHEGPTVAVTRESFSKHFDLSDGGLAVEVHKKLFPGEHT